MKRPSIPDPVIVPLVGGREIPTISAAKAASPADLRQTKVDEFKEVPEQLNALVNKLKAAGRANEFSDVRAAGKQTQVTWIESIDWQTHEQDVILKVLLNFKQHGSQQLVNGTNPTIKLSRSLEKFPVDEADQESLLVLHKTPKAMLSKVEETLGISK